MPDVSPDNIAFLKTQGLSPRRITPIPNDWSPRQFTRIETHERGFVMLITYAGARDYPGHEYEATLRVSRQFQEYDLPIPHLLASDDSLGAILVEDFGTRTIHGDEEGYLLAVEILNRMAAQPVQPGVFPDYAESYIFKALRFLMQWSFNRPDLIDPWLTLWREELDRLQPWPQILSHMDFHAGNLFRKPDGSVGMIDHQAAMIAPAGYDLINLIEDIRLNLDEGLKQRCLERYAPDLPSDGLAVLTSQFHCRVLGQIDRLSKELGRDDLLVYRSDLVTRVTKGLDHPSLIRVKSFLSDNQLTIE